LPLHQIGTIPLPKVQIGSISLPKVQIISFEKIIQRTDPLKGLTFKHTGTIRLPGVIGSISLPLRQTHGSSFNRQQLSVPP
jgi:hypothetical protein